MYASLRQGATVSPFIRDMAAWAQRRGVSGLPVLQGEEPVSRDDVALSQVQRQVLRAFCGVYHSYKRHYCHLNVAQLLQGMDPGVLSDAERTWVLVIQPKQGIKSFLKMPNGMRGKNTLWQHRTGAKQWQSWSFHVCLDVQGRVYDFDYAGFPGTPMADYVADMFAKQATGLFVRKHNINDYLFYCGAGDYFADKIRNLGATESLDIYARNSSPVSVDQRRLLFEGAGRFTGVINPSPQSTPPWWDDYVDRAHSSLF